MVFHNKSDAQVSGFEATATLINTGNFYFHFWVWSIIKMLEQKETKNK